MTDPAVSDGSPQITHEQLVRTASRLVAVYMLFWAAADLSYLPHEVLSVMHYVHESAGTSVFDALHISYWFRNSILYLAENIFRVAFWLLAAGWFFRCGPRIKAFFSTAD